MMNDIKFLIINLRKGINIEENWENLKNLISGNLNQICETIDSRWLISICDTYIDFGDEIESRNALSIVTFFNMEKLSQTNLLLFKKEKDIIIERKLIKGELVNLWDGITSFDITCGDLTNNLFNRIENKLSSTPILFSIYNTLINRLKNNPNSILVQLNKYHKNIFNTTKMKSYNYYIKSFKRKIYNLIYKG